MDQHLDKAGVGPVYVVTGDQDLLREEASFRIRDRALGGEPNAFNYEKLDGEQVDGATVVSSANLLPMLGGRRVVLVKRGQRLLEKSPELLSYLEDPAPQTTLLLELSKSPDKRRKAWKDVEKRVLVLVCDAPKPAELESWVSRQAAERELRLGPGEVKYLVQELGSDLRRLANELEKLSLFAGRERLNPETIATILGRGKAQNIFRFVDAVGSGESAKALEQLGRLLEEGEPPLRILALVDRLIGQLRVAKEHQAGGRGGGLAQVLGVPSFAAKSIASAARRFETRALDDALRALADVDRILKSSALPARLVLESLTVFLCAGAPATGRLPPRRVGA